MDGTSHQTKAAGVDSPLLQTVRTRVEALGYSIVCARNDLERPPVRVYVSRTDWARARGVPEWKAPPYEERQ